MTTQQTTRLLALQSGMTYTEAEQLREPCPISDNCPELEQGPDGCCGCDLVTHGGCHGPGMV